MIMWHGMGVSILVIVEVTLKFNALFSFVSLNICFNPCYSGSNSKILVFPSSQMNDPSFNPCYSGSNSKIIWL